MASPRQCTRPPPRGFAWSVLLLVVVWLLPWLGAEAAEPAISGLTASERSWLAAHPVIRMGSNRSAPPFTYVENGEHRGIDAELMRRLGAMLGVEFRPVVDRPWDEVQAMARAHEVDVLGMLPPAPERADYLLYSDAVTEVEYALFARSDGPAEGGLRDLVGRRVAVVGSYAARRWLERDYPGVVVVPVPSAIDGLHKLATGEVDAAVATVGAASLLIRQQGIVNLRLQQVLYRVPVVVGVRKDWPQLVTILNKAIAQLDRREVDRIKAAYVPLPGAGYSRQQVLLAVAATAALAFGALLVVAGRALRRERRLGAERHAALQALEEANEVLRQRIAAHERTLAALETSEHRFRQLFENSLSGVLIGRPDGSILAANPAACRLFGLDEASLRRLGRAAVVDAGDPRLQAMLAERAATGRARGEASFVRADGTRFEAEVSSSMYADENGQPITSTILGDVTERRRAEAELRLLRNCVLHLNDMVLVTEADPIDEPGPRIVFANEAASRVTGYTREELLGRSPRLLQGPQTSAAELERIGDALRRGEPVRAELVNHAKDGHAYWIELAIAPIADERGRVTHFVAVEREIDERKRAEAVRATLEDQLREAQKMEAIGTLAGGIAHDFNNILGVVLGHAALVERALPPGSPAHEDAEQIVRAAQRARQLVQQILAFSRRGVRKELAARPVVALVEVVRETARMLQAMLPASVQLTLDLPPAAEALQVRADSVQLQQVLLNLCTNAWQAMPEGRGNIAVRLAACAAGAAGEPGADVPDPPPASLPAGEYVHLCVADDGSGMDESTRQRVFDPFFTTKPPGQGTGLGMAVVHGIVRDHGGEIRIDSAPGTGTRVHVWLPRSTAARADGAAESRPGAAAPAPSGRGERVLYVDDDEVLRLLVGRVLEQAGYRVSCVRDADAALRAVHASPSGYDLVVTDYSMPGLDGVQLAHALKAVAPDLPVVLTSGFLGDALRERAEAAGVRVLVRKERMIEDLEAAVDAVLHPVASDAPA